MDVPEEELKSSLDRKKFEEFTTDCFGPLKDEHDKPSIATCHHL